MKKVIHAAAITALLTSFSAFAHHPAEAIMDADTWAMIDQNLQDADSPHLDLDFDAMGSAGGSAVGAGSDSGAGGSSRGGSGSGSAAGGGSGSGSGSGTGGGRR